MRIAVYYNLYFSGAKRSVFEQVKGLKKLGHHLDVYSLNTDQDTLDPGLVADNKYLYGYKKTVINFPFLRKISQDLSDFFLLRRLHQKIAEDIDQRRYDIALVQTDHLTQAPFVLRYLKTRNVYVCLEPLKIAYEYGLRIHDSIPFLNRVYESINRSIRKKIDRDNARSADFVLAISNFGRELMIQSFDLYPKIFYLGVDTKHFKKINAKKKNQVLFLGQKLKMNGYDYAMNAINLIPEKIRPDLKIVSIKESSNRRLTDQEVVRLYNESIATLSLSNFDTFGLVPLESLACEVPVVAFNVAAYRETIKDLEHGFLVNFDAKEIADKLAMLIRDKELSQKMGRKGRVWVENNWTWEKQIKRLNEILLDFLKSKDS